MQNSQFYQPMFPYGQQNMQLPYQQQIQQNPYTDRIQQFSPFVNQFQGLNGKLIDTIESVTASDVPMDGSFAVFPKKDISEVYIKYWQGDGKIATVTFKPVLDVQPDKTTQDDNSLRFGDLDDAINRLTLKVDSLYTKIDEVLKPKSTKTKKEVNADE